MLQAGILPARTILYFLRKTALLTAVFFILRSYFAFTGTFSSLYHLEAECHLGYNELTVQSSTFRFRKVVPKL